MSFVKLFLGTGFKSFVDKSSCKCTLKENDSVNSPFLPSQASAPYRRVLLTHASQTLRVVLVLFLLLQSLFNCAAGSSPVMAIFSQACPAGVVIHLIKAACFIFKSRFPLSDIIINQVPCVLSCWGEKTHTRGLRRKKGTPYQPLSQ